MRREKKSEEREREREREDRLKRMLLKNGLYSWDHRLLPSVHQCCSLHHFRWGHLYWRRRRMLLRPSLLVPSSSAGCYSSDWWMSKVCHCCSVLSPMSLWRSQQHRYWQSQLIERLHWMMCYHYQRLLVDLAYVQELSGNWAMDWSWVLNRSEVHGLIGAREKQGLRTMLAKVKK